ncbi:hypothetical protein, partial [Virgibacillus salexigens]|uniref:hypothetical protein n=1 Tax=Virgibacillus salexigens TaxID=61016 RepID=UPI003081E799
MNNLYYQPKGFWLGVIMPYGKDGKFYLKDQRGNDDEQDQFIFAGSVFEAEGKVHAFYTGYNRNWEKEGKTTQVLLHAYSDNFK